MTKKIKENDIKLLQSVLMCGIMSVTKEIQKEGFTMTFCESHTNSNGFTILDGYSNAKTIKGALKDLAKEVAKISESESNCIIENMNDTISNLNMEHAKDCYFINCEDVSCATKWNENKESIEYKNGNFYLCIGFVA